MSGIRALAPHVDSRIYTPTLQSFARVSVLLSDCYELIRRQELIGPNGELRPSVETVRRLALTQAHLAEKLGLTPAALDFGICVPKIGIWLGKCFRLALTRRGGTNIASTQPDMHVYQRFLLLGTTADRSHLTERETVIISSTCLTK